MEVIGQILVFILFVALAFVVWRGLTGGGIPVPKAMAHGSGGGHARSQDDGWGGAASTDDTKGSAGASSGRETGKKNNKEKKETSGETLSAPSVRTD
jgi:hypothetical protein